MGRYIKDYTVEDFIHRFGLLENGARILNAGSSSVRYGSNCVNIDIQNKPDVDVVCDAHDLPESIGQFDAIICNAMLQYCRRPHVVAENFHRVLVSGGYLFVDAPWVQPFCEDTPDLYRFSERALEDIFAQFEIVERGHSIRPGSALAGVGERVVGSLTTNKYANYALRKVAATLLNPLRWITTADPSQTAGAFYIICRKR